MDSQILRILKKVCLFLFTGNLFVHAVIGASITNGFIKGGASMLAMLVLITVISRADLNKEVKKSRKKRQKDKAVKNAK